MTDQQFDGHIERLKFWGMLAALGFLGVVAVMAVGDSPLASLLFAVAILLMAPFLVYLVILIIWHWKARYRGTHSDLWGAFLIIETRDLQSWCIYFGTLFQMLDGQAATGALPVISRPNER